MKPLDLFNFSLLRMLQNYRKSRIFAENTLISYLDSQIQKSFNAIISEKDDYLLNVNEEDYIKHIVSKASVELVFIHPEKISVSQREEMIPADMFPPLFNVIPGDSYKKDVITFHLPYDWNKNLLHVIPNSRIQWTMPVEITDSEICFETINFKNDPEAMLKDRDETVDRIMRQYANVVSEVNIYNNWVDSKVRTAFHARKQRILEKGGFLAALWVPIKKTEWVATTFSVPSPKIRKSIEIARPTVKESWFKPEPTLDMQMYNEILWYIHDVWKEFERLPSLYKDKEEEHLRDHFLMILEPHFKGSATGETFNKTGKTDVLLRYEGTNVFVAECKFRHWERGFLATINQLLWYLTRRDSKAAVIMFVNNKDFSSVIETAAKCIRTHSNYIDFKWSHDETWSNYTFHLNGDRNRAVQLAVMLYHIPK